MASTAQIVRNNKTKMSTAERVIEFFEIIRPLGFDAHEESDNAIYMNPVGNYEKGVRVWVDQEDYPMFTVNGKKYYREVFFDFIWDDERHGTESMNSDMILAITAEYMKKYPDALFQYEWYSNESPFFDKIDIETIISQPFHSGWYYLFMSHLHVKSSDKYHDKWILE
ncbi:MAG: hypothetical protein K2K16_01580 [Ruminococcus sp.]|nr:hypothetical protein [Ruminococcus sp.]